MGTGHNWAHGPKLGPGPNRALAANSSDLGETEEISCKPREFGAGLGNLMQASGINLMQAHGILASLGNLMQAQGI